MTNSENQSPPEAEIGIMSGNKTSLTKKQKLFGGIASLVALVGIGFGGFSVWQGLSSNAAGEDSVGRTATTTVPAESPYFKITAFDQQNVKLMADGEAERTDGGVLLKPEWRIERTTTPDDSASWKVALDNSINGFTAEGTAGQSAGMYDLASLVIDPTQPQCNYCMGSGDVSARMRDANTLQPGTAYYYRASKLANDGLTWEAQGPSVNITTLTYPTVNASIVSGDLLSATWSESHPEGKGLGSEHIGLYYVVRTDDANLLKKYHEAPRDVHSMSRLLPTDVSNAMYAAQDQRLPAGTVALAQPKSSTYYYAIVLGSRNGIIPVMDPQKVTTSASSTTGLISATLAPTSTPWTQQSSVKVTVTQLIPGKVNYTQYYLSNTQGTNTSKCISWIIPSNSGGTYITEPKTVMPVCNATPPSLYASTVTTSVKAIASTPSGQIEQTVKLPFNLSKVNTSMTAAYAKTTIKASNGGAYATVNIKTPAISDRQPVGTLKLKDLATGKFIYSYNSGQAFSVPTSLQLKPLLKPGKYRLALVFTEKDANGAYFNNKTINLPQLTVNK